MTTSVRHAPRHGDGPRSARTAGRDRAARFSDRAAACRAAARIRDLDHVPRRAVRVVHADGWATVAIPASLIERDARIHGVVWTEGGLPDWPCPRS
jgi:hypothetical protein